MVRNPHSLQSRRRTGRRYTIVLFLVFALLAGWAAAWKYAAGQAEAAVEGWRAREARAGRVYSCGAQTVGGFPFRIEVNCERASAQLHGEQTPLEIRAPGILVEAQMYRPDRLVSEFVGPLTIAAPGQAPTITANWTSGQSIVTGTPRAPESATLIFERPTVDRLRNGKSENLLSAKHIELSGRVVAGSAADHPVIEVSLHAKRASAPGLHPAAEPPIDADLKLELRGLADYAPKPWAVRFRELQAAGGRIDIVKVRLRQGDTLALGKGSLSIDGKGQLAGELRVTVAGIEPFLAAIGAAKAIQKSPNMDKVAGMLDRLAPGLGEVARQQAGANLGVGISMLGKPATLDGRQAVILPLLLKDGTAYLGPIPLGPTPALF
jgi:hypothetical protein